MPCGVIHTELILRRVPAHANAMIRPMTREATPNKTFSSSFGVDSLGTRRSVMTVPITGEVIISVPERTHCSMPTVRLLGLWAI